jgi:hypothetical protein
MTGSCSTHCEVVLARHAYPRMEIEQRKESELRSEHQISADLEIRSILRLFVASGVDFGWDILFR